MTRRKPKATPAGVPRSRRSSHFQIDDLFCKCGGAIWCEDLYSVGKASRQYKWECYCAKCKTCDPNGYPSLVAAFTETPAFWTTPTPPAP